MTDKSMRMRAARICLHYDLILKIKNRKTSESHVRALLQMGLGVIPARVEFDITYLFGAWCRIYVKRKI